METLCKRLQNEKGVPIVKIRSDHGKEFENARFELFCKKNGIKREFSAPKTPQQNGVVERKNRVILDGESYVTKQENSSKVLGRSREHLMSHW